MKKQDAARASREGMVRLGASLAERLAALGYESGSALNGLLSNSWAGRETSIAQAERALRGLRCRRLAATQRAVVDEFADALADARVRFHASLDAHARPIAGTLRLSALLVPFGAALRPASARLRTLWREGATAPRELVEEALREIKAVPVSDWGAADKRELVRELSGRLGVRANPEAHDPRVLKLADYLGPSVEEIGTLDVAAVLGISRTRAWAVMRELELAGDLQGSPRDRHGDWVDRDPATGRPVRPAEIFWSVRDGKDPAAVALRIVALASAPRPKSRRSR